MEAKILNNNKTWFYRIKSQDENTGLETFLNRFNFSKEAFASLNPTTTSLTAGNVLLMPASSQYYHIVAPLDTYESIAKTYSCSIEHLKSLNGTRAIFIGQKIFI